MKELEATGELPIAAADLHRAMQIMNLAVHGRPVEARDADEALNIAARFAAMTSAKRK